MHNEDRSEPPPCFGEPYQIPADQPHDPTVWWAFDHDGWATRDDAVGAQHHFYDRITAPWRERVAELERERDEALERERAKERAEVLAFMRGEWSRDAGRSDYTRGRVDECSRLADSIAQGDHASDSRGASALARLLAEARDSAVREVVDAIAALRSRGTTGGTE